LLCPDGITLVLEFVLLRDEVVDLRLELLLVTACQVEVLDAILDLVELLLLLFFERTLFSFELELHLLAELLYFVLVLLVGPQLLDLQLLLLLLLCLRDSLLLAPQLCLELLVQGLLVLIQL
jgi:hypothetical protein